MSGSIKIAEFIKLILIFQFAIAVVAQPILSFHVDSFSIKENNLETYSPDRARTVHDGVLAQVEYNHNMLQQQLKHRWIKLIQIYSPYHLPGLDLNAEILLINSSEVSQFASRILSLIFPFHYFW